MFTICNSTYVPNFMFLSQNEQLFDYAPDYKVYWSGVEGPNRRGRPLGRWEDRVKEYESERGARGNGLEWARRECMGRVRSVCRGHSLGGRFRRE